MLCFSRAHAGSGRCLTDLQSLFPPAVYHCHNWIQTHPHRQPPVILQQPGSLKKNRPLWLSDTLEYCCARAPALIPCPPFSCCIPYCTYGAFLLLCSCYISTFWTQMILPDLSPLPDFMIHLPHRNANWKFFLAHYDIYSCVLDTFCTCDYKEGILKDFKNCSHHLITVRVFFYFIGEVIKQCVHVKTASRYNTCLLPISVGCG